jgi:hypothetical protein
MKHPLEGLLERGPRETTVIAYFTRSEAAALAQFVKRIGWAEISANSVDRDEAEIMRDALERLRVALAESGFDPR